MHNRCRWGWLSLLLLGMSSAASAQGLDQYFNTEAPVHRGVAIAEIGGDPYALVCNAPDNSIEVYTAADAPRFMLRVPVGQEPVSVVARPSPTPSGGRRFYVANWLGDSVTWFDLEQTIPPRLSLSMGRTVQVGDEPTGITFLPEFPGNPGSQPGAPLHESVFVTFSGEGTFGWFFEESLDPAGTSFQRRELLSQDSQYAVKDPRAVAFSPARQLFVLNFRGGNEPGSGPTDYDFDVWAATNVAQAIVDEKADVPRIGGLGTTNFDMAFAANGDLYVVSHLARNNDPALGSSPETAIGEPIFQAMATTGTGFVQSMLYRLPDPTNPSSTPVAVDLNDDGLGGPVSDPVTQPTSVVIRGDGTPGSTRIFVTGMSSDSIGVLDLQVDGSFVRSVIDLSASNSFDNQNFGGVMRGPRAAALYSPLGSPSAGDRLFVYNRVEHSLSVIDAATSSLITTKILRNDPTPAHVRDGRPFLYSSRLSGNGTVSCSSCHTDGRTDYLSWNLSDNHAVGAPGSPGTLEGALGPNPAIKGPMFTQNLIGLVNYEVDDDEVQDDYFSNRPYHWRGDRGHFEDFNGAFLNLLAINPAFHVDTDPLFNKGISDAAMTSFREFTFSMHYPPNPLQPWDRLHSGSLFDEGVPPATEAELDAEVNDFKTGSGALWGLKLFHNPASAGPINSCVQCHTWPVGSDNTLTEAFGIEGTTLEPQSIETAQLRGMTLKETRVVRTDASGLPFEPHPDVVTGSFGLAHTGQDGLINGSGMVADAEAKSIRGFMNGFEFALEQTFGSADVALVPGALDALAQLTREFDHGVAPSVGTDVSIDSSTAMDPVLGPLVVTFFADLEAQAKEANCGVVVHAFLSSGLRGFFFDVRETSTPWQEVSWDSQTPIGPLTSSGLLDLLDPALPQGDASHLLVVHAVPLGSEQRIAHLGGGTFTRPASSAPSAIVLEPCRARDAFEHVTRMTGNIETHFQQWHVATQFPSFLVNLQSYWFHLSLAQNADTILPIEGPRHEPPRRFRVSGSGIDHGAVLRIYQPLQADISEQPDTSAPTMPPSASTHDYIELPVHPARDDAGNLVWETDAEIEPILLLAMMNGGNDNPWVREVFDNPHNSEFVKLLQDTQDLLQPLHWNWWYVEVWNRAGDVSTRGVGGWQRLLISD